MRSLRKLTKRYFKYFMVYLLMCCVVFNVPLSVALASPGGHDVQYGNVTVHYNGSNTIVDITSNNAIINWQSLNTLPGDVLRFLQLSSSSAVLNRITSALPTQFDGALIANGRVFIVNPAGVIFGESATVNVNQLVASGLNISNEDFLNGVHRFEGGYGDVINKGNISAEKVTLIGKHVRNAGTIVSPNGYVIMAAGDKVFIGQPNSNILVEVDGPASDGISDVVNEGLIEADNGQIVLAAGDIFSHAIENVGTLSAKSGTVTADAARVGQFGTVNVDAVEGDGGTVRLTASEVVALGSESVTTANAGDNGDGGDVILFSPENALFREGAQIEARGGAISGDGGFIDVSGKEYVEVAGSIDLSAANGASGEFLIDPYDIIINDNNEDQEHGGMSGGVWSPGLMNSQLDIDVLEGYLGSADVTISTDAGGAGNQTGNVTFLAGRDLTNSTDYSLTVDADGAIRMAPSSGIDFSGDGSVTFNAGDFIEIFPDADIYLAGDGSLTLNEGSATGIVNGIPYTTTGIGGNLTTAGSGDITFTSNVTLSGSAAQSVDAGTGTLTASGDITKTTTGALTLGGAAGINISGDLSSIGLTLEDDVTASGAGPQEFDAEAGTLSAKGITKATGALTLGGAAGINISGDLSSIGLTLEDDVTANGTGPQEFDAEAGTLSAKGITKATNALTLGGAAGINIFGDLSSIGLTLEDDVTASGVGPQEFDAEAGTLSAKGITKATNALTLGGAAAINIFGDLSSIGLTLEDDVTADGAGPQEFDAEAGTLSAKGITKATNALTLGGAAGINIFGNVTALGGMINFRGTVDADGDATQTFSAGATIDADGSITKTGVGGLTLTSAVVNLDGGADVQAAGGDLVITGLVVTQNDLHADGNVTVNSTSNSLIVNGSVRANTGEVSLTGGTVRVGGSVEAGTDVTVDSTGDLVVTSYVYAADGDVSLSGDSVTVDSTITAWNNATVTANNDITLHEIETEDNSDAENNNIIVTSTSGGVNISGMVDSYNGDVSLTGDNINLAGDVTGVGITFDGAVTADGGMVGTPLAQTFDATTGTLLAEGTIGKTNGDLTLLGDILVDLNGTVTGDSLVTIGNGDTAAINVAGDVTALGGTINFGGTVDADGGATQTFSAAATIDADGSITKTGGGGLTLTGAVVNLDDGADVQAAGGDLVINGIVAAGNDLLADGSVDINGNAKVAGDVIASNGTIDFSSTVIADGGVTQTFSAAATIDADGSITKTGGGGLTLTGAVVNLDDGADVQAAGGDLVITGLVVTQNDLHADGNVTVNSTSNSLIVNGSVRANTGEVSLTGGTVRVGGSVEAGTDVTVDSTGDLVVTSYVYAADGDVSLSGDSVTVDSTITAWNNATVTANNDITLHEIETEDNEGDAENNNIIVTSALGSVNISGMVDSYNGDVSLTGDSVTVGDYINAGRNVRIKSNTGDMILNGDITGNTGGVSLTATGGRIYTDGDDSLNVNIEGTSDHTDVSNPDNNVAISIVSGADLILGPDAMLTANGNYDSSVVDDRGAFGLRDSGDHSGEEIDVALYLKSNGFIKLESGSGVWVDSDGTMLMDALTDIIATDLFAGVATDRLEVVSRETTRLQEAISNATLPSADDIEAVEANIGGTYMLRGGIEENGIEGAWELYDDPATAAAPIPAFLMGNTVTPVQIANQLPEMLAWLMEELGITEDDLRAQFADAFIYGTDIQQYVLIAKLKQAAEMLKDPDGTGFAALAEVINEFVNTSAPPSPEQFAAISQALSLHVGDGTNYASAVEMLDAFADYVDVLTTEMGLSMENAVSAVLDNYDSGDNSILTAMLVMHLNALGG